MGDPWIAWVLIGFVLLAVVGGILADLVVNDEDPAENEPGGV